MQQKNKYSQVNQGLVNNKHMGKSDQDTLQTNKDNGKYADVNTQRQTCEGQMDKSGTKMRKDLTDAKRGEMKKTHKRKQAEKYTLKTANVKKTKWRQLSNVESIDR